MIHVVARIQLKPGMLPPFLLEFRELAVLVRQEAGCMDYFPARDVRTGMETQEYSLDAVTIFEKWSDRRALEAHLRSGHMRSFQDRIKDMVLETRLSIIEEI